MVDRCLMKRRDSPRLGDVVPTARGVVVTHLLADAVMAKVLPALEAARIEALPVKGFVTARQLYGDVSERPITDVDLRVRPRDVEPLARLVAREGWTLVRDSKAYRNVIFRIGSLDVDVEAAVGPPGLCGLSIDAMLARAEPVQGAGFVYKRPEIHDHALFLCVNAFKDKLTRAAPWALRDLEKVVRDARFEVPQFLARVEESRVVAITWIVADWMARVRGDHAWREILEQLGHAPRPLFMRLYRVLQARDDDSLPLRLLSRAASDAPLQRARALAAALRWEVEERRANRKPFL